MQLVIGTYERFLLGYKLPEELQEECQLQRSFTHAAHQGPVRCLAAAGPWVVSGGQDDQLHIYDVKHNKDLGFMMNPGDGAIPCLQFYTHPGSPNPSHLFSGSDDGSIAIWKAGGGWEHLKLMRGHSGPVRGLSVHPSGRLALSVGHDRGLRMWNLAKGRCSYTAKLELEADGVAFSGSGESYALLCDKLISLHSVGQAGSVLARLQHTRRCTALAQTPDGVRLLSGLEDGRLLLWDVRAPHAPVAEVEKAHAGRIRAITVVTPGAAGGMPLHLASASSDGVVKLWDSRAFGSSSSSSSSSSAGCCQLAQVSTSGRITGMVLSAPDSQRAAAAAVGAGGAAAAAAAADGAAAQAPAGAGKTAKQKKQKQQKQQAPQQQQQQPGSGMDEQPQQQQQQQQQINKPQRQQQQQQQKKKVKKQNLDASVDPDDTALVPRVQTKIIKKKKRPSREEMQRAVAAAVGGPRPAKSAKQPGKKFNKSHKK